MLSPNERRSAEQKIHALEVKKDMPPPIGFDGERLTGSARYNYYDQIDDEIKALKKSIFAKKGGAAKRSVKRSAKRSTKRRSVKRSVQRSAKKPVKRSTKRSVKRTKRRSDRK